MFNCVTVLPAPEIEAPRIQVRRLALPPDGIPKNASMKRCHVLPVVDHMRQFPNTIDMHACAVEHASACRTQASHFVYGSLAPHPPLHPRLTLARPDLLVLACSGGLLTVHLSLRVRLPAICLLHVGLQHHMGGHTLTS